MIMNCHGSVYEILLLCTLVVLPGECNLKMQNVMFFSLFVKDGTCDMLSVGGPCNVFL